MFRSAHKIELFVVLMSPLYGVYLVRVLAEAVDEPTFPQAEMLRTRPLY